ncbi:MAG: hypothetical protein FJ403_21980 [Verrucomicrobia bacterium]|nr:hypothetical protein [Verrucomicrobiota bacterium]
MSVFGGSTANAALPAVGPDYIKPSTEVTPNYKAAALGEWKEGRPLDHLPKGSWREIFGDRTLNELAETSRRISRHREAAPAL